MSKIEVNTIDTQCGTALQVGCTNTTTIGLGKSGDTITVPAGATIQNLGTATGFGGTGVVSWDTSSIKTTGFTAVTGTGYFCNTTGGTFNVTLPLSPSPGDVIGVADYAQNFAVASLVLDRNGSNLNGFSLNSTLETQGLAVTLVYVDGTKGWVVTDSGLASDTPGPEFIVASGGTPACGLICGDYKTHTFTGTATLTVSAIGNPSGSTQLDYLVVAGGGGARGNGGGGGAGGFRVSNAYGLPAPLTSPLANPTGITAAVQGYPITIGGGGAGYPGGACGVASSFATITSAGGGLSGGQNPGDSVGGNGGSGGGGDYNCATNAGGTGNTPPVSPPQGQNGGPGAYCGSPTTYSGGGGGGAGAAGGPGAPPYPGGFGGAGSYISPEFGGSNGTTGPVAARYFSGGGGADSTPGNTPPIPGGSGGGGSGGPSPQNGTTNTGGGAGGSPTAPGSSGGSGIVIIRYKFQ